MNSTLRLHETDLPSSKLPFTWKLYEMLEDVEKNGQDHIISWVNDGTGFRVHDLDGFVDRIIPKYFKQTKYKSFQRQLYFYNFKRISFNGKGESSSSAAAAAGSYSHPKFIRGKKQLCLSMTPKKSSKFSTTGSSSKTRGEKEEAPVCTPRVPSPTTISVEDSTPRRVSIEVDCSDSNGNNNIMPKKPSNIENYHRWEETHHENQNSVYSLNPAYNSYKEQQHCSDEKIWYNHPSLSSQQQQQQQQCQTTFHEGDECDVFNGMTFHFVEDRYREK
jgi:hypothetical protein